MTEQPTMTTATEEQPRPCFVRHEDAGGPCEEPAVSGVGVYGLHFCAMHGEAVWIGAALEATEDAVYFFDRFRNPHVPDLNDLVDRELAAASRRLENEGPSDEHYYQALMAANPDVPEAVRSRTREWERDEAPYEDTVVDYLLGSLGTLHKLMRLAHQDRETWIVEVLEIQRESVAAQAAYALRNRNIEE